MFWVITAIFVQIVCVAAQQKPNVVGACGGIITDRFGGAIASPGFPIQNYPGSSNCTYIIEVEEGDLVAYNSLFMDLEPGCLDKVKIWRNGNQSGPYDEYCDQNVIPQSSTTGNRLIVQFISDSRTEYQGFALSWYALNVSELTPHFNCSFDGPVALCPGWSHEEQKAQWRFSRGEAVSLINTGPSQDQSGKSGRFAYLRGSSATSEQHATLISPQLLLTDHDYCLSFWYHNRGEQAASVEVALWPLVSNTFETFPSIAEETGGEWMQKNITISQRKEPIRIMIDGKVGNSRRSGVAVDNIMLYPYECMNEEEKGGSEEEEGEEGSSEEGLGEEESDGDGFDPISEGSASGGGFTAGCDDPNQFSCDDIASKCIDESLLCDGKQDCPDGSDEKGPHCTATTTPATTTTTRITCPTNLQYLSCVSCNRTCDGVVQPCPLRCEVGCGCPPNLPVWHNGRCIIEDECPIKPEPVSNLVAQNITEDSVIVAFDHTATADSYDIMLEFVSNSAQGNVFSMNATRNMARIFYEIMNLLPGTNYNIQVRSNKDSYEALSNVIPFTTLERTTTPTTTTTTTTTEATTQPDTTTPLATTTSTMQTTTSRRSVPTECERRHASDLEIQQFAPNIPVANCTSEGQFYPRQCGPIRTPRECWCADPNTGREIPATKFQLGLGRDIDCLARAGITTTTAEPTTTLVATTASTTPDTTMVETTTVMETIVNPTTQAITTESTTTELTTSQSTTTTETRTTLKVPTACERQRVSDLAIQRFAPNIPVANCTADGQFYPRQCGPIRTPRKCWCADPNTGREIPATKFQLGLGREIDCLARAGITTTTTAEPTTTSVATTASTTPDTTMVETTTIMETTVNPTTQVITTKATTTELTTLASTTTTRPTTTTSEATTTTATEPMTTTIVTTTKDITTEAMTTTEAPTTESATRLTVCQLQYNSIKSVLDTDPGLQRTLWLPNCTNDGQFYPRQCNSLLAQCRCVDTSTGEEIEGTKTQPNLEFELDCSAPARSKCQQLFDEALMRLQNGASEVFAPNCLMDGSFASKQCDSTGSCWCVDAESGDEVTGTRTPQENASDLVCIDERQSCGQVFTNPMGQIQSPNFPKAYTVTTRCTYTIQRSTDNAYIEVKIADMELGLRDLNGDCSSDRLELTNPDGSRLRTVCAASDEGATMYFDSNAILNLVPGDYQSPSKGFSIDYKIKECNVSDQMFSFKAGDCDATCDNLNPRCTKQLVMRCVCPSELPVVHNNRCIAASDCPRESTTESSDMKFGDGMDETTSMSSSELTSTSFSTTSMSSSAETTSSTSTTVSSTTSTSEKIISTTTSKYFAPGSTTSKDFGHPTTMVPDSLPEMPAETTTSKSETTAAATTATTEIQTTSSASKTGSDMLTVIEVDSTTACVRITHNDATYSSYVVNLEQSDAHSELDMGSSMIERVNATKPYTYACFQDLNTVGQFRFSVRAMKGNRVMDESVRGSDFSIAGTKPQTTAQPIFYPVTDESIQWQNSFNQWKEDTLNRWFSTITDYTKSVEGKLPDIRPDPTRCPEVVYKPPCEEKHRIFTDYNGCLFFICDQPPSSGAVSNMDVEAWKKEYSLFTDYLMPQWQRVFEAYSKKSQN